MARRIAPEALELATLIRPGETIAWGQAAAEPMTLVGALLAQRHTLGGVKAFAGISWNEAIAPETTDGIAFTAYCVAGRMRLLREAGRLDPLPVHYSQLEPHLAQRVDVLFLQLAPGRAPGRFSFGFACEYLWPLVRTARLVVAEVNDRIPSTPGLVDLGEDDIDIIVATSRDAPEPPPVAVNDAHRAIGAVIAGLTPEGATLQVGLGAIPAACLDALAGHRHLGVHTGLFVDGLARLIETGAVDNSRKPFDAGVSVAGLITGTAPTHALCAAPDLIRLAPTSHTHSPLALARIERFTSINSAIEVDLTGQINAETAGRRYVGAVGGAVDFARGAALSPGGLPICALQAARRGRDGALVSAITPRLSGPATIGRADAGVIVTEFGAADLRGRSLAERARALIGVAHPDLREDLERAAREAGSFAG